MSYFTPGEIVHTFTTKDLQEAVIRFPKWEDLNEMIYFINKLSEEDTCITFSGETITTEGEMYYLSEMFKSMQTQQGIYLTCFIGNRMVGSCTVMRDIQARKRSFHVGIFGITIAKDFRHIGIGEALAKMTIATAKKKIPGLRLLVLNVFAPNTKAQKLYKKIGFQEYGNLQEGIYFKGEYVNEIKMMLPLQSV